MSALYTFAKESHYYGFFSAYFAAVTFQIGFEYYAQKTFVAINFHAKRKVETSRDLIFILINVSLTVNYNVNFQLRGNKLL